MDRSQLFGVFQGAADGVHIVANDQRIIFWNQGASRILGYEPEEAMRRHCFDLFAGSDYQGQAFCRRRCPTAQAVARGRSVPNYDILSRTREGREVWLNVSVLSVPDPEGDGRLAVHLFRDVSSRRQAEILAQQTIAAVSKYGSVKGGTAVAESYPAPRSLLTRRELEVLRLLTGGMHVANIAGSLGIKQSTARNHIDHILARLGVHSRLEAVVFATQHRLV